jgi:rare lipoprotein A (peptidoglycan hydrolase)
MEKDRKMTGANKFYMVIAILLALIIATPANAYCEWPCFDSPEKSKVSKTYKKKTKTVSVRKQIDSIPIIGDISRLFQAGIASFYWQPQAVACGGRFNPNAMTAAHKTLKCGSKVKVTNKRNGKSVVVTINDRGPYIKGRIIDLSKAAAQQIGMVSSGLAPVTVEVQ